jgi:hypothetical protein
MFHDGAEVITLHLGGSGPRASEGGERGRRTEAISGVELREDGAQSPIRYIVEIGKRERGDPSSSPVALLLPLVASTSTSTERPPCPKVGL